MKNGIILIGCGIHSQDNYLPFIGQYKYNLKLIVDICESKESVINLAKKIFKKLPDLYFVKKVKNNSKIRKKDYDWLSHYVKNNNIGYVIISTDPLSHKMYLEWALRMGLNILCEKPLTSYKNINNSIILSRKLRKDFKYFNKISKDKNVKIFIQAQRRYHPVYRFVYSLIKKIILNYGIPISYIGIFSGNGIFNSIDEYITKENHPHNMGYGKLMHSGYHFVDLFCWFANLNTLIDKISYNNISVFSDIYSVGDLNGQLKKVCKKCNLSNDYLFKTYSGKKTCKLNGLGEVDVYSQISIKAGDQTIINGQLALLQNSVSKRFINNYKSNDIKNLSAIRKEIIVIELGPLYSVSIFALQNYKRSHSKLYSYDYIVKIYRNTKYIKGRAHEEIFFRNTGGGKNIDSFSKIARLKCFQDFLGQKSLSDGVPGGSLDFNSHKLSIDLFSLIQENIAKINLNQIGFSRSKFNR